MGTYVFYALFAWYFLHWMYSEMPESDKDALRSARHVTGLFFPVYLFDIYIASTHNGYTRCISRKEAVMHTTLFFSNRTQAVRLPKSISFPEDVKHVEIIAVGRSRIITPVGESWDSWFDGEGASTDFMSTREQPAVQEREGF